MEFDIVDASVTQLSCPSLESHNSHYWEAPSGRAHCPGFLNLRQDQPVASIERLEAVDHPVHYGGADNPYETIKVLEAWLTPEALQGFCVGNAIKYVSRAGRKDPAREIEDLKKARWYLDYAIELLGARQLPNA